MIDRAFSHYQVSAFQAMIAGPHFAFAAAQRDQAILQRSPAAE
jgi:hypothetical protein